MSVPHHRWLLQQLPQWQQEGLLTPEAAATLRLRSEAAATEGSSNVAQIVMGSIGALLIGAGLIAVIGYNWDDFSRPIRLLFAFIPLLGAQVFSLRVLKKKDHTEHWIRETAALLQTLTAGACIALVSQMYNLGGDWPQFVLVWLLIALPLAWVMGAHSVAMFYLIGSAVWLMDEVETAKEGFRGFWIYCGLFAGLIPYALGWGQRQAIWPNAVRWIAVCSTAMAFGAAAMHAVEIADHGYQGRSEAGVWLLLINAALYTLLPLTQAGRAESIRQKPQVVLGFIALICSGFVMTYSRPMAELVEGVQFAKSTPWTLCVLALLASFIVLAVRQKRWAVLGVAGIALLPGIGALFRSDSGEAMAWVATVYLSLAGLALIILEFTGGQGAPRLGAALLCALIITRFADSDLSLLYKGVVFIIVGVCFLAFNIYLGRWRKAQRILP
jgi:uncharacterized membrane protein